jgi:anaphase-promoting complex subunit 5
LAETCARAEEWVDLARHTGDPYELANALILLASALMFIGDQESARRSADEALAVARRTGLRSSLAIGSSMVASMLLPDEPEQALRLLDEAVAVGTDAGDLTAVSAALSFKAWFAAYQGQSALALSLAREGSELMTQAGLVLTSGPCLLIAAVALANLGQPEPAAILLSAGRKLSVRGPTWTQQLTDRTQASLIEQLGRTRYDTLDAYGAELTVDEATATLANAAPDSP